MTENTEKVVMTVSETAKLFGFTHGTVYAAIKRGDIPSIRIGKHLRIPRQAVLQMIIDAGSKQ